MGSKRLFSVSDQHKVRLSIARHTPRTRTSAPPVCDMLFFSQDNRASIEKDLEPMDISTNEQVKNNIVDEFQDEVEVI